MWLLSGNGGRLPRRTKFPQPFAFDVLTLTGQAMSSLQRPLIKVASNLASSSEAMASSRFDRVRESIQTSLATLKAYLSLPTTTGGIFRDTGILSAQSALIGGGRVIKMSKQIKFTRHVRLSRW